MQTVENVESSMFQAFLKDCFALVWKPDCHDSSETVWLNHVCRILAAVILNVDPAETT